MTVQVKVGPPSITINQGTNFMVTNTRGEIRADTEDGLFFNDTRVVSLYRFYINGQSWEILNASAINHYAARYYFASPVVPLEGGELPAHRIGLTVTRVIGHGVHEDVNIVNYAMHAVTFTFETALRSDFADLFEVKSHHFYRRGLITSAWDQDKPQLINVYQNGDFIRRLAYQVLTADVKPIYANGRVVFEITLGSGESWHACILFLPGEGDDLVDPDYACDDIHGNTSVFEQPQTEWRNSSTRLDCRDETLQRSFRQAVEDMGALRLHEHDLAPNMWVPAAGVPWFVALFGRDTLIASLQNMIVQPRFALGTLKKLAQFQATEREDWRDAQPGKIMHELRVGELAHLGKLPHSRYYGTADATILYLITLHEAWKWLGDASILHEYRDVAMRCLDWIDQHGDLDGDGFQEYKTYSPDGYENMGWKDSWDAVVYPNGKPVRQPKALCELQGYVFDAKLRMAEVFEELGEPERAGDLRRQASDLRERFNEHFWMQDEGFIAYGLDPNKQQIKTVASNAAHCLWSGILAPEHAGSVVQRLMQEDMSTGWGIRTISSKNPAFNPYSYQLGSVWPHDNGIAVAGFRRYGYRREANQIARDVLEAASCFDSDRLPELYAGLQRVRGDFPVQYLGASVPQAWAAGSVFHIVRAILGLEADAPRGRLYVDPALPDWLPEVEISNLNVGDSVFRIRFWQEGPASRWEVLNFSGSVQVLDRS